MRHAVRKIQFGNANSTVIVWILPTILIKFEHFFSLDITNCEHLSLEIPATVFVIAFEN